MIYLSGMVTNHSHPNLGFILTPDMGNKMPVGVPVAGDNACFNNPNAYTDDRYKKFLQRLPPDKTLFATAPDVMGNHLATVEKSLPVLRMIRDMGLPAAFVAQDGWEEQTTPWDEFDVIFIGGTTEFKLGLGAWAVANAKIRGKKAHMGRVNSLKRIKIAREMGCDTVDGTFLKFGPEVLWPRMQKWLTYMESHT